MSWSDANAQNIAGTYLPLSEQFPQQRPFSLMHRTAGIPNWPVKITRGALLAE
jgi:hypothetical protein